MMIDEGSMAGGCVSSFISVKNPTDHNFSEQFLSRIFQRKFTSRRSDEIWSSSFLLFLGWSFLLSSVLLLVLLWMLCLGRVTTCWYVFQIFLYFISHIIFSSWKLVKKPKRNQARGQYALSAGVRSVRRSRVWKAECGVAFEITASSSGPYVNTLPKKIVRCLSLDVFEE